MMTQTMNIDSVMFLLTESLLLAAQIVGPILLISLIVGLLISIFQVVTQIQEMTLTFVPKLVALGLTAFFLGHWILTKLVDFASSQIASIASF